MWLTQLPFGIESRFYPHLFYPFLILTLFLSLLLFREGRKSFKKSACDVIKMRDWSFLLSLTLIFMTSEFFWATFSSHFCFGNFYISQIMFIFMNVVILVHVFVLYCKKHIFCFLLQRGCKTISIENPGGDKTMVVKLIYSSFFSHKFTSYYRHNITPEYQIYWPLSNPPIPAEKHTTYAFFSCYTLTSFHIKQGG